MERLTRREYSNEMTLLERLSILAQAAIKLAAYEDTGLSPEEVAQLANPWISLEFPEECEIVLAATDDERVVSARRENGAWFLAGTHIKLPRVVSWMPLPLPPKGAK